MRASVIVLAHGPEPYLTQCVSALVGQAQELLVVDNGAAAEAINAVVGLPGVRILRPGANLGFAGGCDHAADHASGEVLVFVNSDAVVRPGAVAALCRRVAESRVAVACASIRLADDPSLLNSAGNPVHFLMFSWAGHLGRPAAEHDRLSQVASVSGVAFAVRREVWDEIGGFPPQFGAYCEDTYLSIRAWQAGYWTVMEPAAVVEHHYRIAANPAKRFLLERNRLINLLVLPERRTQRLMLLPAVAVEAGVLAVAARDGWAIDKLAGWRWLITHRRWLAAERRRVQSARRVRDRDLSLLLRGPLDPGRQGIAPAVPAAVSVMLSRYWWWAVGRL